MHPEVEGLRPRLRLLRQLGREELPRRRRRLSAERVRVQQHEVHPQDLEVRLRRRLRGRVRREVLLDKRSGSVIDG